ncbi:hypothetical protein POM88_003822 [Heracleum sosnowskyi]|uniref:2Fe-2S ferredoxin-type domain-containing protein n=1 Tax=Heracleum sosnowskyi TaxID=360622 RepID=A0AAD8JKK8_9APIA|nr:hypothetical protein POM88_007372 [Heracleum sosnowskyi]KAK1404217.1 hypothetical protein POM88_003822 [Heracleum sosnowskyi]
MLPLDPKLGKMLIMGAIFRCFYKCYQFQSTTPLVFSPEFHFYVAGVFLGMLSSSSLMTSTTVITRIIRVTETTFRRERKWAQLNSELIKLYPSFHVSSKSIHGIVNIVKVSSSRCFSKGRIRAVGTIPENQVETTTTSEDPPSVKFAFVSSVLLPDGTPDVHFRTACGGQKLRDIMLDTNIELYGPYSRPLLNCGGGGTCATCIVEVSRYD